MTDAHRYVCMYIHRDHRGSKSTGLAIALLCLSSMLDPPGQSHCTHIRTHICTYSTHIRTHTHTFST